MTYQPTHSEIDGRSTANKEYFKDGPTYTSHADCGK